MKNKKKAVNRLKPEQISEYYSFLAREGHKKFRKNNPEAYKERQKKASAAGLRRRLANKGA